ncbi:MAG: response regulator [Desulfuromonas sp.]|nr:response regulator [Desulfuromonas sp.]
MKVLLVEDDEMIGIAVQKGLVQDGFVVDWVQDGAEASVALEVEPYEVLLLDLGLPDRPGLEILRDLRRQGNSMSVIILTARDAVAERIAGLDAGADDYLIKPFDLDELCARIRAVQRRKLGRAEPLLNYGKLRLDPASRQCFWQDNAVILSAKEFSLLEALIERPGAVLSRAQLEERLYGWGEEVESNTIEVHIHHLRKKLATEAVRTVRGVGYMLGNIE